MCEKIVLLVTFKKLINLWLHWVFVAAFSLIAKSNGYSLVARHGFLIAEASLVEYGL